MSALPCYSKLEAPHYLQSPRICCITLNEGDKIRLIGVPSSLISPLREGIVFFWGKKIQREQEYFGSHEFKLTGNPWVGYGSDHVPARRLITKILRVMAAHGWNLLQSADVSKKPQDKDSLFFVSVDPTLMASVKTIPVDMFCISFGSSDMLRVIDATPEVAASVRQAILTQWKYGVKKEETLPNVKEFKLNNNPWYPDGEETVYSRMMLSQILANLLAMGYKLYTSTDISIGGGNGNDIESWVFRRIGDAWS
ncbi:hypothetical protein FBU30_001553 [Linnemannia zychae]|nr:hypothetical protein FBU30_001553 [Linnemannia zychae]